MIIERIKHATEEDLEVVIDKIAARTFCVELWDKDTQKNIDFKIKTTKISAQDYAEQLAGFIT